MSDWLTEPLYLERWAAWCLFAAGGVIGGLAHLAATLW